MLLVIPFCQVDYKLALALAKYLQYLGPYKQHEIMLSCPENLSDRLEEMRAAIGDQFARMYVFHPKGYRDGWPIGCNSMFFALANHINQSIDTKCWYMYEPDNTPLKPGWLNTLELEYTRTGRPFLGVLHSTHWRRKDGSWYQDGVHLVGTSIYPKNAPAYSNLFKTIIHATTPWDVYWQWDIVKYSANTNLIQHDWRTLNYARDKKSGEITGYRDPKELPIEYHKPITIRPDAVTHHGCKDGTLMQIMRGMFISRAQGVEETVIAS
jgi:hypothetical protein